VGDRLEFHETRDNLAGRWDVCSSPAGTGSTDAGKSSRQSRPDRASRDEGTPMSISHTAEVVVDEPSGEMDLVAGAYAHPRWARDGRRRVGRRSLGRPVLPGVLVRPVPGRDRLSDEPGAPLPRLGTA